MFEEIITSDEVKFNDLEKKVFKFVCYFGCLIIKMMLEAYDRKLMNARDTKKYRHKGLRKTSVNTVMGEINYKRVMYEVEEDGIKKIVYLLDEKLNINVEGKVSSNLIEKVIETVPITDSYRKAETVIDETTNTSLSHEKIRQIIIKVGDKITNKEKEEIPSERPVKLGTKLKNLGIESNTWNEYEIIYFESPKTFTLKRLNGDYFVKYTCIEKDCGTIFEYLEWAENELDELMEMQALEKLKKLIEEK